MNILIPEIAVAEKVIRSVAVYVFLLVAFRLCGKRPACPRPPGLSRLRPAGLDSVRWGPKEALRLPSPPLVSSQPASRQDYAGRARSVEACLDVGLCHGRRGACHP